MKKLLMSLLPLLCCILAQGQVVVDMSQYNQAQNASFRAVTEDSGTKEPLPYVTVYLNPAGDSTITHFAISGENGAVIIHDIVPGDYVLNAEMIGYFPFRKEIRFRGKEYNYGSILLRENPEYIDAASITAMASPVTIHHDTIVYNAAAFHVGENAMLEDLLKKMPGMEVSPDGTVSVRGDRVDKVTVGGRTFFFNDPAVAVKNLPAKVVDKIRVMEKARNDSAGETVLSDEDKETVMDVELKEEYKNGLFGNAKLSGGYTLGKKNALQDDIGTLFNGNVMVAGYNQKNQLTLLGSARNAVEPGASIAFYIPDDEDADDFSGRMGRVTSGQGGLNFNSQAIKDVESDASVTYTYLMKETNQHGLRRTLVDEFSDMDTEFDYYGLGADSKLGTSLNFTSTGDSRFSWNLSPSFSWTAKERQLTLSSTTSNHTGPGNKRSSVENSHSDVLTTVAGYGFGVADIGKEGRNFNLKGYVESKQSTGNSDQIATINQLRHHLLFDNAGSHYENELVASYVEPLSEKWMLQGRVTASYVTKRAIRNAVNFLGRNTNDFFSSTVKNNEMLVRERLIAQYDNSDNFSMLFGAQADQDWDVTLTPLVTSGENRWTTAHITPYSELNILNDNSSLIFRLRGDVSTPTVRDLSPALDLSDPLSMSFGNIYLRPSYRRWYEGSFDYNFPDAQSTLSLYSYFILDTSPVVQANWFDTDGVRYAFPVNSKNPGTSLRFYGFYSHPFSKNNHWVFSTDLDVKYVTEVSYQATTSLPGLDTEHFHYEELMSKMWGDASGNRFYSGDGGFAPSHTRSFNYRPNVELEYRTDRLSVDVMGEALHRITHYTLDPSADIFTWDIITSASILYETRKGFEMGSDLKYQFYKGYASGFGMPELIWNVSLAKTFKAVTLSLKVADLLGQSRNLVRYTSADYVEDVYRNTMGRYFLFGISFNFGKMNASNNERAQSAVENMLMF